MGYTRDKRSNYKTLPCKSPGPSTPSKPQKENIGSVSTTPCSISLSPESKTRCHFIKRKKYLFCFPTAQEIKVLDEYRNAEKNRVCIHINNNINKPPPSVVANDYNAKRPRRENPPLSTSNSTCKDALIERLRYYDESKIYESDEGEKGKGMRARVPILKGEFILEYVGDLLTLQQAETTEDEYSLFPELGSYMYFFKFKSKTWCIDATLNKWGNGRLINHSHIHPNAATKLIEVNGAPRLYFQAIKNISAGEEILYDYGDRRKSSLLMHPWLINT